MIKAIFFDVDGTLISRKYSQITQPVLAALEGLRKKGIKLFIATGRHYLELEALGINAQFKFDGYLTLNGGYCFSEDTIIYKNPISTKMVKQARDYIESHDLACCFVEGNYLYVNKVDTTVIDAQTFLTTPVPPINTMQRIDVHDVYQIVPFITSKQIRELMQKIPDCKYTQWYEKGYDIIPKAGGKQIGIKAILDYYCLNFDEVMAFGDGENDLEMLSLVGIGICMGNGCEVVKQYSDYVTSSVDNDGIIKGLKHFNLI